MGEWTRFWDSIDRMKREHDETRAKINRRKGWEFLGCEVFGIRTRWRARFSEDGLHEELVERPTSQDLILEIARRDELCTKCFHKLSRCGEKGCTVASGGGKCGCEEHKKEAT